MMDDNYIRLENYEMLKALYDFKATFAKTLSFRENDHFILHQSSAKQRNWWQVVNNAGQLGYIPSNYITTVKVEPQFMINFLDECIDKLRLEFTKPGAPLPTDKQDLIQRLVEKKRQAELSRKPKKQAPLPPTFTSSSPSKESLSNRDDTLPKDKEKPKTPYEGDATPSLQIKPETDAKDSEKEQTPKKVSSELLKNVSTDNKELQKSQSQPTIRQSSPKKGISPPIEIDSHAAYKILDEVRRNTQLSYEMSKLAVTVVVTGLQQYFPSTVHQYFDALMTQLQKPLITSKMCIEESYDANRLKVIFTELTSCKEDAQQRSWMLYEDESIIVEYIKELTSILTNADANVSKHALRMNQYNVINTLVEYYQMEARWTIRQLLLPSFGVMCSLDPVVITIMLNSILPMELARDMRSNPRSVLILNYSSLLLTMIFSMGEPMPITHLEQLGPDFVTFLLDNIENPPDTDFKDQIPDLFLNLILSYNLQYIHSENIVINSLKKRDNAKSFTQKILLLLNREEDPVRIFDHEPAPPHSVLKLFIDLFSSEITASLFYTNDVKVLIDIVLRQLFDLAPGEKRRLYLELIRRVLRTSGYPDHRHRFEDLLKCFTRIFCEDGDESQGDKPLIREISIEFPDLFKL